MKINLAKSSGFCFGVRRAFKLALQTASSSAKVYMLGDIVHNEDVVKLIRNAGIKKIGVLGQGKNKTLLIRAHGASRKTLQKAAESGYKIVDATCPMVKEIHKIARKMEKDGYPIIIIGDKRHDEVQGTIGQLENKATVIDCKKRIPLKTIKKLKKATVIVQSTQQIDRVLELADTLKTYIKGLRFFNTVCRPTRAKQEEIKTLPLENDVVIIIGSQTSANTKRLYEIAKSINRRSFWVHAKSKLRRQWFKNVKSVGIMAGASTPDATTRSVINQIRNYS